MQNRLFKSEMAKAAAKFNLKSKNGIKYLTEKGYIPKEEGEEQVKAISRFLKSTPALSTTSIGEYLGSDAKLNVEVLNQYINEFDFTKPDISFVHALKMMLSGFRIKGEGQIVDRIMEVFGHKMARDRPDEFSNQEGNYMLAYATLML